MKTAGVLLGLMMLGLVTPHAQPVPPSGVYAGIRIEAYAGDTYTTRGEGDADVYFVGEPIRLTVLVGNHTEDGRWLALPVKGEPFEVAITRGGRPVTPTLLIGAGFVQRRVGGVEGLDSAPTFRLSGKEQLTWPVAVDEPLVPGLYRFDLTMHTTLREGEAITNVQPHVAFEVRPAEAAPIEVARRRALRALARRDLNGAERAGHALLKLHPTSHEALVILGRVALVKRAMTEARAHFARALSILENGEDALLRQHRSPEDIEAIRQAIESFAARAPG